MKFEERKKERKKEGRKEGKMERWKEGNERVEEILSRSESHAKLLF